jgi:hypothetical protein
LPHLRDGLIVDKVGHFRGSENPDTLNLPMPSGLKRLQREGDDHFITFSCCRREPYFATAKMGHPVVVVLSGRGHPAIKKTLILGSARSTPSPPKPLDPAHEVQG